MTIITLFRTLVICLVINIASLRPLLQEKLLIICYYRNWLCTDILDYYICSKYVHYTRPRFQLIVSSVGVKSIFTCWFKILHTIHNKFEAVALEEMQTYQIILIYNLWRMFRKVFLLKISLLLVTNCHSTRWTHRQSNTLNKFLEDFPESTTTTFHLTKIRIFLSFKVEKTNTDLLIHNNLSLLFSWNC